MYTLHAEERIYFIFLPVSVTGQLGHKIWSALFAMLITYLFVRDSPDPAPSPHPRVKKTTNSCIYIACAITPR